MMKDTAGIETMKPGIAYQTLTIASGSSG